MEFITEEICEKYLVIKRLGVIKKKEKKWGLAPSKTTFFYLRVCYECIEETLNMTFDMGYGGTGIQPPPLYGPDGIQNAGPERVTAWRIDV